MKKLLCILSILSLFLYSCNDSGYLIDSTNDIHTKIGKEVIFTFDFPINNLLMGRRIYANISLQIPGIDELKGKLYVLAAATTGINFGFDGKDITVEKNTYIVAEKDIEGSIDIGDLYMNVPGFWHYAAFAIVDGQLYGSNEEIMEVTFPTINDMRNDKNVCRAMEDLWKETLQAASSSSRRELGFWIYVYIYNSDGGIQYEIGSKEYGPEVTGCVGTNGSITPRTPSLPGTIKTPQDTGERYYVAYFHTHTTLHYCPVGTRRKTGPSQEDEDYSLKNEVPVLLYDYVSSEIYGGHSLADSYKLSHAGNIESRKINGRFITW